MPSQHCDAVTSCPCLKGGALSPCTLHDSLNKHLPTLHCVLAWAGRSGTEANSASGKDTSNPGNVSSSETLVKGLKT